MFSVTSKYDATVSGHPLQPIRIDSFASSIILLMTTNIVTNKYVDHSKLRLNQIIDLPVSNKIARLEDEYLEINDTPKIVSFNKSTASYSLIIEFPYHVDSLNLKIWEVTGLALS